MKRILLSALAATMLVGCSQDAEYENDASQGGEVRFSATSTTRAYGAVWEANDQVGVFAYDGTNATKSNTQYKITNTATGTMGTATDADRIFYLQGKPLSFYAYYPYSATQSDAAYAVDATDQTTAEKVKALDLLWAKAENKTATDVQLQFSHQMVQLSFAITAGIGDVSDLTGLTATLKGANATANFDLKTGAFSTTTAADIALNVVVAADKVSATIEAFVVPTADLSSVSVAFNAANGKSFTWTPATTAWESGKRYTYNLRVGQPATPITDANFVAVLRDKYQVPVETDGTIDPNKAATAEKLQGITELNVSNKGINSVAGIEYMPNLTTLFCFSNALTSLDVSNNTALTYLYCYSTTLTSLDVSKNTALIYLNCASNALTSLDVSHNTALTYLDCSPNSLTSLDISHNMALTRLDCRTNSLTSLDVSNNMALTHLYCDSNSLTSLDVSNNTALIGLDCRSNSLTSLDISMLTKLTWCRCSNQKVDNTATAITLTLTEAQKASITTNDWDSGVTLNVK